MDLKDEDYFDSLAETLIHEDTGMTSSPSDKGLSMEKELVGLFDMKDLNTELDFGMKGLHEHLEHLPAPQREKALGDLNLFMKNFQEQKQKAANPANLSRLSDLSQSFVKEVEDAGAYYFEEKRFNIAEGIYAMLVILQPNEPRHWLRKGLSAQAQSLHEKACRSFEVAHKLAPQNPGPLLLLSACLLEKGEKSGAEKLLGVAEKDMGTDSSYQETWGPYLSFLKNSL